ncbi:hypothetical protein Fot_06461 [Forsythia ovata]|uniref:Uncharacterized protein n=1 Tax=Forsythia ovata TaxID=205694 RepID=A0ABD1WTF0_9LAMI
MLEMQRQQAAQTAAFNVYLQQGFMHPASLVYHLYRPKVYANQYEHEEEYNAEENYIDPNLSPKYSLEPEPFQASSVVDRLENRPSRNMRKRRAAAATSRGQHIPPPYHYQPDYVGMPQHARMPV